MILERVLRYTFFLYKERFFSTQPCSCLTFSWIELQILVRCCLIHVSIVIMRHFLYLLYLSPYLDLGLLLSYLYDLFFINLMNTETPVLLLIFQNMSHYFYMIAWMKSVKNSHIAKVQPQGVAQHLLNFLPISV